MDNLEKNIKRSLKRAVIKNNLIGLIAVPGMITIGAVVPGVLKMLNVLSIDKLVFNKKRQSIYNAIQRLKKEGLLTEESKGDKKYLVLSKSGRIYFDILQKTNRGRKIKWDKKWRIVIFDIEEKYRNIREKGAKRIDKLRILKITEQCLDLPLPLRRIHIFTEGR